MGSELHLQMIAHRTTELREEADNYRLAREAQEDRKAHSSGKRAGASSARSSRHDPVPRARPLPSARPGLPTPLTADFTTRKIRRSHL